ncbi:MAG: 50S ribosomal protein L21 [bacterium]|nr:50S ribosomal protein L21 [bacterium]MDE0668974.1 50S ribosomal protein L21 [bacterium]MXZ31766.1 50S ribosomal protein L21 [Acidimicrobiia bacterium]MYB23730.1 50S ribosomal protein L21 [Acidimicrobiia bacterium]
MYAVVATGGKQHRVSEGEVITTELLGAVGTEVDLRPVLYVDGESVLATPGELAAVAVKGRVVNEAKGPKIRGFTYKSKSNQRRRWGHRQRHSLVEITEIGMR